MPDERVKHVHVVARAFRDEAGEVEFVGAVMDVTAIRLAERELHKTRTDLAHVMRVTSLGELTASIAHEVNQPLGAVMFNAEACLSWLDGDPPNLNEAHAALERIVRDGTRAGEVIRRIRALAKKTDTKMAPLNLNEVLSEALTFVQHELLSSRVALRMEQASALPVVLADKVQLQQVILNLVINGIEAMQPITDRPRELVIRSEQDDAQQVRVTVTDCGVGFSADSADRLFNTFFTTKSSGMGMGLSICRSIIELHGGRIWAAPNVPHGAILQFTLPLHPAGGAGSMIAAYGIMDFYHRPRMGLTSELTPGDDARRNGPATLAEMRIRSFLSLTMTWQFASRWQACSSRWVCGSKVFGSAPEFLAEQPSECAQLSGARYQVAGDKWSRLSDRFGQRGYSHPDHLHDGSR